MLLRTFVVNLSFFGTQKVSKYLFEVGIELVVKNDVRRLTIFKKDQYIFIREIQDGNACEFLQAPKNVVYNI